MLVQAAPLICMQELSVKLQIQACQPVARGQNVARDIVLCWPGTHLKLEEGFLTLFLTS